MSSYPILAVCSGKGGVGKSTLAFCISVLLAKMGLRIGLLDADIYGPSLHLLFPPFGDKKPENVEGKIIPPEIFGIRFMSAVFLAPGGAFIRAPKATGLITSFFRNVEWGQLDLMVVDFPPGTGDIPLTLLQEEMFDAACVVTTPHTLSVEDAAKSAVQFSQAGVPILGIIENMSYLKVGEKKMSCFGEGGGKELSELLQAQVLDRVPLIDQSSYIELDWIQALEPHLQETLLEIQKVLLKKIKSLSACLK